MRALVTSLMLAVGLEGCATAPPPEPVFPGGGPIAVGEVISPPPSTLHRLVHADDPLPGPDGFKAILREELSDRHLLSNQNEAHQFKVVCHLEIKRVSFNYMNVNLGADVRYDLVQYPADRIVFSKEIRTTYFQESAIRAKLGPVIPIFLLSIFEPLQESERIALNDVYRTTNLAYFHVSQNNIDQFLDAAAQAHIIDASYGPLPSMVTPAPSFDAAPARVAEGPSPVTNRSFSQLDAPGPNDIIVRADQIPIADQ